MLKIYICDDEQQILKMIEAKICSYMPDDRVIGFSSGEELIKRIVQSGCDILFLDIDMPEMNGMDIARRLNDMEQKPLLIFVTSHDELVYESLRYHPFGFIRKSRFEEELEVLLEDCKKELASCQEHFRFRMAGRDVILLLSDILYFEADGNYLKVYTISEEYRFRSTVSAVENSLGGKGFVRIHKGFLVNLSVVRTIGSEALKLITGEELPIGKMYRSGVERQLLQYMRM